MPDQPDPFIKFREPRDPVAHPLTVRNARDDGNLTRFHVDAIIYATDREEAETALLGTNMILAAAQVLDPVEGRMDGRLSDGEYWQVAHMPDGAFVTIQNHAGRLSIADLSDMLDGLQADAPAT